MYREVASYCALVDGDGEVTDFMKLQRLMVYKNTPVRQEREGKVRVTCFWGVKVTL